MPFPALQFSDRKRKEKLATKFGVTSIPFLVVVDSNGKTVTKKGGAEKKSLTFEKKKKMKVWRVLRALPMVFHGRRDH